VILKSETYHFHRLDLTRQAGFIVTIYDEDGLRLASTAPLTGAKLIYTNFSLAKREGYPRRTPSHSPLSGQFPELKRLTTNAQAVSFVCTLR
jgi:hypothetical protein